MARKAIDIVLLPSEIMADKAIQMNKDLLKDNAQKIVLHKDTCLPHISLCMGVIDDRDLDAIDTTLKSIAEGVSPFQLIAEKISTVTIPTGEKFSMLKISNPPSLQTLQELIMKKLWKYLSYDNIDASMFYNSSEVEEVSFSWVKGYAKKYADPASYHPHLSLGIGETNKFTFPINFTAPTLALCQLGNYCTCRKVLAKINLVRR